MGTIVRFRDIRIVIRSKDHLPPHVHAIRGDAEAKIEIATRAIRASVGFSRNDLHRLVGFLEEYEDLLMEAWNEIYKEE